MFLPSKPYLAYHTEIVLNEKSKNNVYVFFVTSTIIIIIIFIPRRLRLYNSTWKLILSDLYRYEGNTSLKIFIKNFFWNPGFKCSFYSRVCKCLSKSKNPFVVLVFYFVRIFYRHNRIKYGISLPYQANIKSGFYIGHFGTIVINSEVTIGKNCNVSQGVTIGVSNRGKYKGNPTIGDNVYIGPGAKIFGAIKVGNNVAIGANCVVSKDVPDNAVVVGIPGRIISCKGSTGYINHIDYNFFDGANKN